jgi:hypothetical protein
MKVLFFLSAFLSGLVYAQTKTEVTSQLQYYNSYVRHNYRMFGSEQLRLSLYSQKQGPQFLQREFSQNIGLPVDLTFKNASTGFSLALEQNSDPTVPRRYMVNWYLSRKLSKKFGANFNFYTDRHEKDKTFTYSNFNAALQYQVTPRLNFNIRSEAGKSLSATEYTINHVIGTTWAF